MDHKQSCIIWGFLYVNNCNPNGDRGNGNQPRQDIENYGEITDVAIKRMMRDAAERDGYEILLQANSNYIRRAEDGLRDGEFPLESHLDSKKKGYKKAQPEDAIKAIQIMQKRFWDFRHFGGTITGNIGDLLGGVRPLASWRTSNVYTSTHPVEISEIPISRCCTTADDKERMQNLGAFHIVRRAIYPVVFISLPSAAQNGVDAKEIKAFYDIFRGIFNEHTSRAKSGMEWLATGMQIINTAKGEAIPSFRKAHEEMAEEIEKITGVSSAGGMKISLPAHERYDFSKLLKFKFSVK